METINQQMNTLFNEIESSYADKKEPKESFNIFEAFRIRNSELAWSAWIAYLLNPSEKHGKGDTFLKLFLEQLGLPNDYVLKTEEPIVERVIGSIDKDYENGGRIDIIIHDPETNNALIIENKIFAADQLKQLYRYYKDAKRRTEKYADFRIYYLTLLGNDPSYASIKGDDKYIGKDGELQKGIHFYCISYISDIQKWLKKCLDVKDLSVTLRHVIKQSFNEINFMCHQTEVDADFRNKVEKILNDNGKKSIADKLAFFNENKYDKYQWCSKQITSLKKIYQRELFDEMMNSHFQSPRLDTDGKIDGYWVSTAYIGQKGIISIQIMHDWKADGTGQLICSVDCEEDTDIVSTLKQVKGVWFKDNQCNPLFWSFSLDDFEGLYKILDQILTHV